MVMEDVKRRLNLLLDKQERIIEELFRHSHQNDLLITTQEKTNILLENILRELARSSLELETGKKMQMST